MDGWYVSPFLETICAGEDTVLLANGVTVSPSGLIRKSVRDNMVFHVG